MAFSGASPSHPPVLAVPFLPFHASHAVVHFCMPEIHGIANLAWCAAVPEPIVLAAATPLSLWEKPSGLTHGFGTPGALLAVARWRSSPCRQPEQGLQGAAGRARFWRSVTATWQGLCGSGWVPAAATGIIKSRSCTAKQPQLPRGVLVRLSSARHCAQRLPDGPRLAAGEAAPENCLPQAS